MSRLELLEKLNLIKDKVNKNVFKTIKGQIYSGDLLGAERGISRIMQHSINSTQL